MGDPLPRACILSTLMLGGRWGGGLLIALPLFFFEKGQGQGRGERHQSCKPLTLTGFVLDTWCAWPR